MTPRLATHVHVRDSAGAAHIFGPDDEVPGWAAVMITNPAAWADGSPPAQVDLRTEEPTKPTAKRAAPRRKAATTNDDAVQRS